jgi:hypothetical protein
MVAANAITQLTLCQLSQSDQRHGGNKGPNLVLERDLNFKKKRFESQEFPVYFHVTCSLFLSAFLREQIF